MEEGKKISEGVDQAHDNPPLDPDTFLGVAEFMYHCRPPVKTQNDMDGIPRHRDSRCWPPEGVAVLYLYTTAPEATTRGVLFEPVQGLPDAQGLNNNNNKQPQILFLVPQGDRLPQGLKPWGFLMEPGSIYIMGSQVFERDSSLYTHATMADMPVCAEYVTVLLRFCNKRPREAPHDGDVGLGADST
jgi:hypothetical protein